MKPRVSILIATYNRAKWVARAIETARGQTYPNVVVVVYDDGSDDGSHQMLTTMSRRGEIVYAHGSKNHGVGYARNRLLELADGEYACWLDSDDMSNKWRVEFQVKMLQKHGCSFMRSGFQGIARFQADDIWKQAPNPTARRQFACATNLFPVKQAKTIAFRTDMIVGEDYVWEKEYVLAYGAGMRLPLTLYLVGRSSRFHRLNTAHRVPEMREAWERSMEIQARELSRLNELLRPLGLAKGKFPELVPEEDWRKLLNRCA